MIWSELIACGYLPDSRPICKRTFFPTHLELTYIMWCPCQSAHTMMNLCFLEPVVCAYCSRWIHANKRSWEINASAPALPSLPLSPPPWLFFRCRGTGWSRLVWGSSPMAQRVEGSWGPDPHLATRFAPRNSGWFMHPLDHRGGMTYLCVLMFLGLRGKANATIPSRVANLKLMHLWNDLSSDLIGGGGKDLCVATRVMV